MLKRKLIKKKNICFVCRNIIDRVKNFESRAKSLVLINFFLNYSFGLKAKELLELFKRKQISLLINCLRFENSMMCII